MNVLYSAILFLAAFIWDLHRLCPGIFADDSPETVTAIFTLGVAHMPGDPVLVLLGRLAGFLPVGSPAFRVNILSAALGAVVVVLVWRLADYGEKSRSFRLVSAIAALALVMGNPVLAQQFAVAKGATYGLNLALILGGFLAVRAGRPLPIFILMGLLAAHHWMTFAAIVPALGCFLVWHWHRPSPGRARRTVIAVALLLLGVSPLVAGPIRAAYAPGLNMGAVSTAGRFAVHLARQPFHYREMKPTGTGMARQAAFGTVEIARQLHVVGCTLVVAGVRILYWLNDGILAVAVTAAVSVLVSASLYLNLPPDQLRLLGIFLLPAMVALAVVGTYGAGHYARKISTGARLLLIIFLVTHMSGKRSPEVDVSRFTWSYDLARAMLAPLPPKAALIVTSDLDTFPLWYLQQVEGFRPDVRVVNRILLNHRWYREQVGCPEPGDAKRIVWPAKLAAPSPDMKAASVRAFLDADRRRAWFTSPAPVEGVPSRLHPAAYHLTCRLVSGSSVPVRARGFTWRGVFERYRHIPEPHSELAVGYTLESFQYLAAVSAHGVY